MIEASEVQDQLITDYCNENCPESVSDYHCPNHDCLIWRLLEICVADDVKEVKQ